MGADRLGGGVGGHSSSGGDDGHVSGVSRGAGDKGTVAGSGVGLVNDLGGYVSVHAYIAGRSERVSDISLCRGHQESS